MKYLITLSLLLMFSNTMWSQNTWVKTFGGTEGEEGHSITTTSDKGILITGRMSSNDGDFDGMNMGSGDIFLVKLDSVGSVLWKKVIGGTDKDEGESVTTIGDDIVITGYTYSNDGDFKGVNRGDRDLVIVKLDKNGSVLWQKTMGGSGIDMGLSISAGRDNTILISGEVSSTDGDFEAIDGGNGDIVICKLDSYGNLLWKQYFGGMGNEGANSHTTTSKGDILITGTTVSNDGDFKGMNKGKSDIFIIKLDNDGHLIWKKVIGGSGWDERASIAVTPDDGVVLTGRTRSNDGDFKGMMKGKESVVFIVNLDQDGKILWKKTIGGEGDGRGGSAIACSSDGGFLITGEFYYTHEDGSAVSDVFCSKLDKNGKVLWEKTFSGDAQDDESRSIAITSDDYILITGGTPSHYGDFNGRGQGYEDIFVMKLDSNGNLKPSGKRKSKK